MLTKIGECCTQMHLTWCVYSEHRGNLHSKEGRPVETTRQPSELEREDEDIVQIQQMYCVRQVGLNLLQALILEEIRF